MGKIKVFSLIWTLELVSHKSKPTTMEIELISLSFIKPFRGLWVNSTGFINGKSADFCTFFNRDFMGSSDVLRQQGLGQ